MICSDSVLQGECSTWQEYMAKTHNEGVVYPAHRQGVQRFGRLQQDSYGGQVEAGQQSLLPTAMDAYTTAAYPQGLGTVDSEHEGQRQIYLVWYKVSPMNTYDHLHDSKLTIHRRGYTACVLQAMQGHKLSKEEYNDINAICIYLSPMLIYNLRNWNNSHMYIRQFLLIWEYIVGLPNSDRHHVILTQALAEHGFDIIKFYNKTGGHSKVTTLLDYMQEHQVSLKVPTGLVGELQPGHPNDLEDYMGSRAKKAARTSPTQAEPTTEG